MDNCFHPGASYCPSGFCDCNCDAGDPGCPLSDDATAKGKLFKVLKKSYNKVQRAAHINSLKTRTSFTSKRVNDDDGGCVVVAMYVIWGCLSNPDVVDDDSWMACVEPNLGDDCRDLVCGALDDGSSFLSCPDDTTAKAKLFKVLSKSYNKVQRRAHIKSLKTKMSFTSKRVNVNDDHHDDICLGLASYSLWGCMVGMSDNVVDDDSLMSCMVGFLSDDCHDPVCDSLASIDIFLSCP